MTWHDEKEPAVYGPGEKQRELRPDEQIGPGTYLPDVNLLPGTTMSDSVYSEWKPEPKPEAKEPGRQHEFSHALPSRCVLCGDTYSPNAKPCPGAPCAELNKAKEPGQVAHDFFHKRISEYRKHAIFHWVDAPEDTRRGWAELEKTVLEAAGVERLRAARFVLDQLRKLLDLNTAVYDTEVPRIIAFKIERAEQAEKEREEWKAKADRASERRVADLRDHLRTVDEMGDRIVTLERMGTHALSELRNYDEENNSGWAGDLADLIDAALDATKDSTSGQPGSAGAGLPTAQPGCSSLSLRWRVGRTSGRTLYRDEQSVGRCDTAEVAAEIVATMNAQPPRTPSPGPSRESGSSEPAALASLSADVATIARKLVSACVFGGLTRDDLPELRDIVARLAATPPAAGKP